MNRRLLPAAHYGSKLTKKPELPNDLSGRFFYRTEVQVAIEYQRRPKTATRGLTQHYSRNLVETRSPRHGKRREQANVLRALLPQQRFPQSLFPASSTEHIHSVYCPDKSPLCMLEVRCIVKTGSKERHGPRDVFSDLVLQKSSLIQFARRAGNKGKSVANKRFQLKKPSEVASLSTATTGLFSPASPRQSF